MSKNAEQLTPTQLVKFAQIVTDMNKGIINIIAPLNDKWECVYTYKISEKYPVPNVGDQLQIPKIEHDKSDNSETICEVTTRRFHVQQGQGLQGSAGVVSVSLFVSVG